MFMIEICCGVACFLDFPFLFSFVFLCVFLCHLSVNNAALIIYTTVSSILCGFSRWRSATTTAVNMILIIPSKAPTPFPASPPSRGLAMMTSLPLLSPLPEITQ